MSEHERAADGSDDGAAPGEAKGEAKGGDGEPRVAMMMAMDRNRLIGREGGMPWHVPGEQAYFRAVTTGKPIVMGRKTHESIGRALPGRTNIVVTRDVRWRAAGVTVAHSLEEALAIGGEVAADPATPADELVVIGGAALCRDAMPSTERLYLTVIDHAFEGDTWLDSYHPERWRETSREARDPATTGGLGVVYLVLERVAPRG